MGFMKTISHRNAKLWAARCTPQAKVLVLVLLVMSFVFQSALVYSDRKSSVLLDEQAVVGRQLWMQNNCQACHQLHGFGGFLGPDLTNAAARLDRDLLDVRLGLGQGQMPAFEMDAEEVDALWAFLEAMDQTGIGQARSPNIAQSHANAQTKALESIIAESGDAGVAQGFEIFQTNTCQACHVLYAESTIGAPDLSISGGVLDAQAIHEVLEFGRPPLMPPSRLSAEQRSSVQAFMTFLAEHRERVLERATEDPVPFWRSLPWWEYE